MWHFQLYKGAESGLLLSEDSRNAYETEVTEDVLPLATCGWYGCETISKGDYNPITNQPVYTIVLTRLYATDSAISDGISFYSLTDFSLVIAKPDKRIIYTGCNWSEISESGEVSQNIAEKVTLVATGRVETKA